MYKKILDIKNVESKKKLGTKKGLGPKSLGSNKFLHSSHRCSCQLLLLLLLLLIPEKILNYILRCWKVTFLTNLSLT